MKTFAFPTMTPRRIVGASRYKTYRKWPYLARLLFQLKPVEREGIGGITASKLRLFYDPQTVNRLDVEYLPTTIAHKVSHILRQHDRRGAAAKVRYGAKFRAARARMRSLGFRKFEQLWERCACMEIDDDLVASGFQFHSEHPPKLAKDMGLKGRTAEAWIAELVRVPDPPPITVQAVPAPPDYEPDPDAPEHEVELDDEPGDAGQPEVGGQDGRQAPAPAPGSDPAGPGDRPPQGAPGDDKPSCGGCAGNPAPWEDEVRDDEPLPAGPNEEEAALRQAAAEVREWASSHDQGDQPAGWLLSWAQAFLLPPRVDWKRLFASRVRGAVATARGALDWKTVPVSRRRAVMMQWLGEQAPLLPKLVGPDPRIVAVVDTSGSMGSGPKAPRLRRAATELLNVAKQSGVPLFALAVDAAVQATVRVRTASDIVDLMKGGGGTDMPLGVRAAAKLKPKADVIVLLTDGETSWVPLSDMPDVPLVTMVVNERRSAYDTMPAYMRKAAVWVDEEGE